MILTSNGNLALTGTTDSIDFPVTANTAPAYLPEAFSRPFLAYLDASGTKLVSAHILPYQGHVFGVAATANALFVTLRALSVAANATLNNTDLESVHQLPGVNMYPSLLRFDVGSVIPTYFGPLSSISNSVPAEVAITPDGKVLVAYAAGSKYNLPNAPIALAILSPDFPGDALPTVTQVVNPASLVPGNPSPGQLLELRGVGFGSAENTRVFIDGQPVPLLSIQPASLRAVAPASFVGSIMKIAVERDGVWSAAREVATADVNPALFTASNTGSGQALAFNEDGSANSPQQPATKGRALRLLVTGVGSIGGTQANVPAVRATVSGLDAAVKAAGPAIGYPDGYIAVDITVPSGAPEGDFLDVTINIKGKSSQPGVTVAVR